MPTASLIETLKRHEGFSGIPYVDTTGNLTIGYGLNISAGISEIEATMLLSHRVRLLRDILAIRLPFFPELSPARQDTLINMAYNLGVEGLLKFVNTLNLIEQGKYQEAADAMLKSKWARQTKGRAVELADVMRNG